MWGSNSRLWDQESHAPSQSQSRCPTGMISVCLLHPLKNKRTLCVFLLFLSPVSSIVPQNHSREWMVNICGMCGRPWEEKADMRPKGSPSSGNSHGPLCSSVAATPSLTASKVCSYWSPDRRFSPHLTFSGCSHPLFGFSYHVLISSKSMSSFWIVL